MPSRCKICKVSQDFWGVLYTYKLSYFLISLSCSKMNLNTIAIVPSILLEIKVFKLIDQRPSVLRGCRYERKGRYEVSYLWKESISEPLGSVLEMRHNRLTYLYSKLEQKMNLLKQCATIE